ncbi:MAG TPA: Xaa-Pro peptidase family protein [Chloroflexaceae bacterium]|nr:Xaa-Pro peptidase family protein [Chloroflexaceae bacterium]
MDTALFPRFSEGEYNRRYAAIRALMEREGVAALVIYGNGSLGRTGQADLHYISNFLGNRDNLGIFPLAGEPTMLVQSRNHAPDAARASVIADTRWGGRDSGAAAAAQLRELGVTSGTIGLVGGVPYQQYLAIRNTLPDARLVDLTRQYRRLRVEKSDEEIAWLRRGAAFTDAAMRALEAEARPGLREYELGAIVESAYLRDGGQPHLHYISSTAMGASDRCVPAQNQSERVLQAGDVVLTEISAAYWGYSGQILRPIAIAAEPPDDYRELYAVAEEAYHRVCAAIRPGATSAEVLEAARYIDDTGYTICDGLVHGFGIGLLPPNIDTPATQEGPLTPFTFKPNMCVVVQPNIITPDHRKGVQLGNLCVVTESGLESLQQYPLAFVRAG